MMYCVLIVVFVIWFEFVEGSLTDDHKKHALFIDNQRGSVFDIPYKRLSKKSLCGSWVNACPARSAADETFVARKALTKNALFVKQICPEGAPIETVEFQRSICFTPFQTSALFNKINFTFEFGYEVYFSKKNKDLFPKLNERKNYIPVEKLFKSIFKHSRIPKRSFIKKFFHFVFGETDTFKHSRGLKMNFEWIKVFEVEFDFERWTPNRIFYQVRNNNRWPVTFACTNYDLAKEAYEQINIARKYTPDDQRATFAPYILPDASSEAACGIVCLKQWPLIPINQFQFGSLIEYSCPHMATIPIWQSTLELVLMKVDKFIYALFQAMGPELHIISGISGHLQLAQKHLGQSGEELSGPKLDIYLNMLYKKIPVPDIIYKVVKYKLDHCPEDSCWYSATIIIHNNPFFEHEHKICQDVTVEWGWTEVTKYHVPGSMEQHFESKYIYVCKSEPELLERLLGDSAKPQPGQMKDFDLLKIPSKGAESGFHDKPVLGEVSLQLLDLADKERKLFRANKPKKKRRSPLSLPKLNEEVEGDIVDDDNEDNENNEDNEDGIVEEDSEIRVAEEEGEIQILNNSDRH